MSSLSMVRQYWRLPRAVHVLCVGTLVNRAGTFLVPFLAVYLREQLGLTVQFATGALAAYGLGAIIAALLGGHLADWIGRRKVMLFSLLGGAVVLLLFGRLKSPAAIVAGLLSFALIAEMYRPAASAMIADLVEPARRPHAFGLMYLAVNLGFALAPIIAGLLIPFGFRWLFVCDAATAAAYALIIVLAIRETLPTRQPSQAGLQEAQGEPLLGAPASASQAEPCLQEAQSAPLLGDAESASQAEPCLQEARNAPMPGDRRDAGHAHAPTQSKTEYSFFQAAAYILRDGPYLVFCLASLLTAVVYIQSMSTFPIYLQTFGVDAVWYGRIIAVNGLMIVCCQLPLTSLVSLFNRTGVMIAGTLFLGVGFSLVAAAGAVWQYIGAVIVWTLGEMMQVPLLMAIPADLAPLPLRARYMSLMNACFSIAMMIGAPLGGWILAGAGGAYVWIGCLAVSLVAAVLYACIRRQMNCAQSVGQSASAAATAFASPGPPSEPCD